MNNNTQQCAACRMYKDDKGFYTSFDLQKFNDGRCREQRYTHPDKVAQLSCKYAAAREVEGCLNTTVEVVPYDFENEFFIDENLSNTSNPAGETEYFLQRGLEMKHYLEKKRLESMSVN